VKKIKPAIDKLAQAGVADSFSRNKKRNPCTNAGAGRQAAPLNAVERLKAKIERNHQRELQKKT
jgi:hypothetical protein